MDAATDTDTTQYMDFVLLNGQISCSLLRVRDELRRANLVLFHAVQTIRDPRQTIREDLDLVRL